jgi:ankyrin repeat protein
VLLEHGANVGAEDKEGRTPLHAAAEGGNGTAEVVSVLLEHGANVGAKDNKGRTPFQIASAVLHDSEVAVGISC